MADETESHNTETIEINTVAITTAAERLRAFEDAEFGADAVRVGGHIERGSGSKFSFMTPAKKREYATLERLVEAEAALSIAASAHSAAQSDFDTAAAAADHAADQSEPKTEA